jgi:HSP20 family protein
VKWLARERSSGSFLRQFNLGDGIATDKISAHYENGVLSVVIPMSERAKPRKVAVTGGASESAGATQVAVSA